MPNQPQIGLSGGELLRAMHEAEQEWLDAARAADIVNAVVKDKKAAYDELQDRLDEENGTRRPGHA